MDLPLNFLQKKKRPTDELHIGDKKICDGTYLLGSSSPDLDRRDSIVNEDEPAWDTCEKPTLPEDSYWAEGV
jgi:hypothetical protein